MLIRIHQKMVYIFKVSIIAQYSYDHSVKTAPIKRVLCRNINCIYHIISTSSKRCRTFIFDFFNDVGWEAVRATQL